MKYCGQEALYMEDNLPNVFLAHNNIILSQANTHTSFYLHDNFFNNGHVTVFSLSMRTCLCSQCASCQLFDTCCDQAVLFSLNLVIPTGRLVFLLIQICNSLMVLYLVNQLTTFETVCTATGRKLCWFCLLWRLTATYSLSALLLWRLLNHIRHGFQGRYGILPTYDFFEWQISCTSPTLSFSMPAPIGYPI